MLLWPEANHTSPTRTSFTSTESTAESKKNPGSSSVTFIVRLSDDASIGSRSTRQAPVMVSTSTTFDWPANSIFTFFGVIGLFGFKITSGGGTTLPQTGTFMPHCSTAPSVNGAPISTAAKTDPAQTAATAARMFLVFIFFLSR